ncbi:hypothetical protein [Flavobacterium sp.]|jgi:hypothetical protein|uniref:hypothetical protein n=1 Tax=Flavobacterium sp. TaxID=239 RepID=UPI0037BF1ED4
MKVNPEIKDTLKRISEAAVKMANDPDKHFKFIRRISRIYDVHLNEEERAYLMTTVLEMVHYRNIVTDPEVIMQAANVRMRTIMFVFIMAFVLILAAGFVFKTNESLLGISEYFFTIFKAISLTKGSS